MKKQSDIYRRVVEAGLGVTLLIAAVLKGRSLVFAPGRTANLHGGILFLVTLIAVESLLGLWLIVVGRSVAKSRCALGCFFIFAVVSGSQALRSARSCGCFGDVELPPEVTCGFDALACTALWLTRPRSTCGLACQSPGLAAAGRIGLVSVVAVALPTAHVIMPAFHMAAVAGPVIDPISWINKPFTLDRLINASQDWDHGQWLLIFYHYDCDECRRAIPNYAVLAAMMGDDPARLHMAFVAIPPYPPPGQDPVLQSTAYLSLSFRNQSAWAVPTPVVVALRNGTVLSVAYGQAARTPADRRGGIGAAPGG